MVDPINISDALARTMELLESGDYTAAAAYLRGLHPADSAEVIADLEPAEQAHIAALLGPEELAGIFEQLDEEEMVEVAEHLDVETLADVLDAMEPDMAADLLGEIEDENVVNELLEEMEESDEVQPLLEFEEDTAGGIMNSVPPCLRRWMTVAEAFRFIRENYHDVNELFYLYVLDRHGVLIGVINLRGNVIPILNLRRRFGMPDQQADDATRIAFGVMLIAAPRARRRSLCGESWIRWSAV